MAKASVTFTLDGPETGHDVKAIKKEIAALPGVFSVSVSDSHKRVAVDFDTTGVQSDRIGKQLADMGYQVINFKTDSRE